MRRGSVIVFSLIMVWMNGLMTHPVLAATLTNGDSTGIACASCHTCEAPTADSPCLKMCPRLEATHVKSAHQPAEGPDSVVLSQLADLFEPVHFNHKLHAEMSQMGGECSLCHHYSPPGQIPPCSHCHGGETNPANLRQPSLKGAYHRQCLSCHREWNHETRCILCHLPVVGRAMAPTGLDSTDIMGLAHPAIHEPGKRLYRTPYQPGPVVTFYHKQHIDLFGLRCVDCHKQENCSRCHDLAKPAHLAKTQAEIHATCNGCHGQDRCDKCHDTAEKAAFTHVSTGWPLNRYHRELDCRACHPTGRRIARLNSACVGCHGGWNQGNFKHAVTGLQLDGTHVQLECIDCHANRQYDAVPNCAGCHDDGRSPQEFPPGEYLSRGR